MSPEKMLVSTLRVHAWEKDMEGELIELTLWLDDLFVDREEFECFGIMSTVVRDVGIYD